MQRMSRAQKFLLIYMLLELEKPRIIRRVTRSYGAGGIGKHGNDWHTSSFYSSETDIPVLTDAKYPNALLLDGSRKMTGDTDIDTHSIFGSGTPNILGFGANDKRFLYGGFKDGVVYGAYMQMFGRTALNAAHYGCAEFVLDSRSQPLAWFRIYEYTGAYNERFEVNADGIVKQTPSSATMCRWVQKVGATLELFLQTEVSAFSGWGIYKNTAPAAWLLKVLDTGELQPQGDITMLDQKMMTIGTYTDAQRPAAGTVGRVIFNTDDGQPNYDDGTNWRDINGNIT